MTDSAPNLFAYQEGGSSAGIQLDGIETIEFVGEGATAAVFRARIVDSDEEIALKVMRPRISDDAALVSRFMLEAETLSDLNHPHIMRAYKYGTCHGLHYIALSFVRGRELAAILSERGKLPLRAALEITRCVADGLAYGHQRGLLHRDIKPQNIMVELDGDEVKSVTIVDFGLVKDERSKANLTVVGMVMGTPQYISPESAQGMTATAASDVYSLGIVLYEMIAGEPPFDAGSTFTIIEMQISDDLPLNTPEFKGVNDGVLDLLEAMCEKSPAKRIASSEVCAALTKLLAEL